MMRYEFWGIVNNGQLWSKSPKFAHHFCVHFHIPLPTKVFQTQMANKLPFPMHGQQRSFFFPNQGWLSVESDFTNIRIKIIKMPPMFEQFHFLGIVSCSVVVCDNSWNILSPVIPVGFLH